MIELTLLYLVFVFTKSWQLNENLKSYRAFNKSEDKSYCLIFFALALRVLALHAFAVVYNQKPVPTKMIRFTDFGRLRVLIGLQRYPKSYKVSALHLKYNQQELFFCFECLFIHYTLVLIFKSLVLARALGNAGSEY